MKRVLSGKFMEKKRSTYSQASVLPRNRDFTPASLSWSCTLRIFTKKSRHFLLSNDIRRLFLFSMNFRDKVVSMTNFKVDDETIGMGDRSCKVYSLVDVDYANLPSVIRPYANIEVNNTSMPVDLVSIVDSVPGADCVVLTRWCSCPTRSVSLPYSTRRKTAMPPCPTPAT